MRKITGLVLALAGCAVFTLGFTACEDGGNAGSAAVTLDKSGIVLKVNESYKLNASYSGGESLVWTADDEDIVYVDGKGEVTGLSVGSAVVTVTAGKRSDFCQITVTETGDVSADDEVKKDGYILYEDFDGRTEVPGYLKKSVSGTGRLSVSNGEMVLGTTGGGSAFASYIFDETLSGKIIAETRVKVASTAFSNIMFFYKSEAGFDNGDIIACLGMNSGGFTNHNGSGWGGSILNYKTNTWYEVKMILDIGSGKYDLYIDGIQYASQSFRKKGDGVEDRIKLLKFGTDKAGGRVTYDYIKISKARDEYAPVIESDKTTYSILLEDTDTVALDYRVSGNPKPSVSVISKSEKAVVGEDNKTITFAPDAEAGIYEFVVKAESAEGVTEKTFKVIVRGSADDLLNADFTTGNDCGLILNSVNGSSSVTGGNLVMSTASSGSVLASAMYDFGENLSGKIRASVRVKNDSPNGTFMNLLFLYREGTSSIDAGRCTSSIAFNDGYLQYHNGSAWIKLATVERGQWVDIEVLYDFDSYTTEISMNGFSFGKVSMRRQSDDTSVLIIGSDKTNANISYEYITFTKINEDAE